MRTCANLNGSLILLASKKIMPNILTRSSSKCAKDLLTELGLLERWLLLLVEPKACSDNGTAAEVFNQPKEAGPLCFHLELLLHVSHCCVLDGWL